MHEIFREGWQWAIEQMIKFWWRFDHGSGYGSGSVSRPTLVRRALAEVCTVPVLLVKSSYHVVIDVVCKFGHVRDGQCPIHWLIGRVAIFRENRSKDVQKFVDDKDKKVEALEQCTPPPRHVLPVSRYGSLIRIATQI